MQAHPFEFVTDTSSLCIYDLAALKHRLEDDADWWCWPPEQQVREVNAGNAAFVDLGADGKHSGVVSSVPLAHYQFQLLLSLPSGQVFVGAAEESTSEGMEPDCSRGGLLLTLHTGCALLQLDRSPEGQIQIAILPHSGHATNGFTRPMQFASNAA